METASKTIAESRDVGPHGDRRECYDLCTCSRLGSRGGSGHAACTRVSLCSLPRRSRVDMPRGDECPSSVDAGRFGRRSGIAGQRIRLRRRDSTRTGPGWRSGLPTLPEMPGSPGKLPCVYDLIGGVWTQVGGDIVGEAIGDEFGYSLDLSADGGRLAVGGRLNDESFETRATFASLRPDRQPVDASRSRHRW